MSGGSVAPVTSYRYKPEVLDDLARHGVRPTPSTPPERVHEFVNDLYRYELRRLRDALLREEIRKSDYYGRVVEVRERYRVLALKPWQWLDAGNRGTGEGEAGG